MWRTFARTLTFMAFVTLIIPVLAACGQTQVSPPPSTGTGGTLAPGASFKLGVSLTFNNTDFWTNYISYETKFAAQYNATLIGPLVANMTLPSRSRTSTR